MKTIWDIGRLLIGKKKKY